MAIYRGPGGAGDATGDATNASALALAAKDAAQASATSAASSATAAASSATAASTSASDAATSATNAAGSATTASTAATNASNSATAASSSATAAASSASDAADSATAAASSATSASTDASTASTQATNAASSASSASTSASTATTKASEAATSATNAASSAATASTAATNASNSASAAATSETNAASSASSASTSATNAASSASTATTQATNASNSASAAATSETNAASSASAASTSASNASTSATNAASSASSAASSAASAAAALDSFDDRYLGSKTSNPTLDNDGNALTTGALYYNSVEGEMRVYDGSQWIAASAASQAILTKYKYVATAGQTTFSGADANALTLAYTVGSIIVTLNGVVMDAADYTATTGTSIVLGAAASLNDELCVLSFSTFDVANTYTQAQADARYLNLAGGTLTGDVRLNNGSADGAQFQLASSGYSDWNLDNYSGRLRAYYGSTEYMTITAAGNVGIGTSSPSTYANGMGPVLVTGTGNNFATVQGRTDGPSGATNGVSFGGSYSTNPINGSRLTFNAQGGSGQQGSISFWTKALDDNTTQPLERARIDSSGNLLVGTSGLNQVNGLSVAPSTAPYVTLNKSATGTKDAFYFEYNGAVVGKITYSDTATAYNTSSDYRLKNSVAPMTGALARVAALKPVTYKWNADNSDGEGFIAHELAEVFPHAVAGEKDAVETYTDEDGNEQTRPVYQGIDTSFLVATLTAAIQELATATQEQQAMIASQSELINAQQAALTTLTERVAALENK